MQVHIELDSVSRQELEHIVHHHPKAYLRERAAAILKIAQGQSGVSVAYTGLLQHRRKNTVYQWLHRYQEQGLSGLYIVKGRGRKPSFSHSDRK